MNRKKSGVYTKEVAGAFWVIGVSAPAVVTGMYLIDEPKFRKGYANHEKVAV